MGAPRLFPFRFSAWSWGAAIDLTARATTIDSPPYDATKVGERTWLRAPTGLPDDAQGSLAEGLARVAEQIDARVTHGHTLVDVLDASFTLTEYQDDAMAPAVIAWACEEFGLDAPLVRIGFDRAANHYVITYTAPTEVEGP